MSCEGCWTSARGMDEALTNISVKAKEYAQEQQKPVAIYQEGYEFRFTLANTAIEEGLRIVKVVSFYP